MKLFFLLSTRPTMTTAAISTTAMPPMINWVRFEPGLVLRAAATDCRPVADVFAPADGLAPADGFARADGFAATFAASDPPLPAGGFPPLPRDAVVRPVLLATTRPNRPTAGPRSTRTHQRPR